MGIPQTHAVLQRRLILRPPQQHRLAQRLAHSGYRILRPEVAVREEYRIHILPPEALGNLVGLDMIVIQQALGIHLLQVDNIHIQTEAFYLIADQNLILVSVFRTKRKAPRWCITKFKLFHKHYSLFSKQ
ncbi:hypothetical protein D3C75_1065360 [compost metagenome]